MDKPIETKAFKAWVSNGITPEAVTAADEFGRYLTSGKDKENVTTSQIRQFFTKLKGIEAKGYRGQEVDFLMLKPMLAYTAGRHRDNNRLTALKDVLIAGIDAVTGSETDKQQGCFRNFCKLSEAILAYHRAHGGK